MVADLHENWPALIKNARHTTTLAGRLLSSDKQWRRYERKILKDADLVITIIDEAMERIIELGIDPAKICMVSNTIDIDDIPPLTEKSTGNVLTIFYGGAINRHRGLQVVLEAICLLNHKNIKLNFDIVGSGSYRADLEKLALKLGISSQVNFRGHKPFHEMTRILAMSDAAIIPHLRTENNDASSPNKLYHYMYLEKPVISSDCKSLKRILDETGAGFTYRSDSAGDLALLLEKLNAERDLLQEKGEKGKAAVLSKYNWSADKERLLKGYNSIILK